MNLLRQSTAATVKLGPFVDATDGATAETALIIAQANIRLTKNGGAYAQTNNVAGATHDEGGEYGIPLDAIDTGTLGRLKVRVHVAGALPCWETFMVVPANVYDSMVLGTDTLQADLTQVNGVAQTATLNTIKDETALILEDTGTTIPVTLAAITGHLDNEIQLILADTDELQIAWADGGRLDLLLDAAAAGGGPTAVEIANEVQTRTIARVTDLTNLTPTAANEITGIKAKTDLIPGNMDGLSLEHLLKLVAAVLLGRASGLDTATAVFRAADNSKARVTATTDASGNRSAVTLDPS